VRADPRTLTRVLDELLWTLRREGLAISTAQALDVARASALVGFVDRERFRETLGACLVTRKSDRARFDRGFDAYFAAEPSSDLWSRLAARGFSTEELAALRAAFADWRATTEGAQSVAFFERGSELEHLLRMAGVARAVAGVSSDLQLGFATHRALARAGLPRARQRLSALRTVLRDALGERGELLTDALIQELDQAENDVRTHFARALARREEERRPKATSLSTKPFFALDPTEVDEVRRSVRQFVDRLRGGARVRRRRALRGRIDPHRTLRESMRTFGIPLRLHRRRKSREKPRLVILCDVSDSVRAAASFMLELVYAAHDLFSRTRSFVFVSDIAETTALFERLPPELALAEAYAGTTVNVTANSNYGRALRLFESREATSLDRRTTVVILGDGRTNFQDDGAEVLVRLRERVRALYWLAPESRSGWGIGDSAMARYEPYCTRALEVRTARELEEAARLLTS
jgi:uncharacterized protein with von Willebrand factor type A (vWA) domain